MSGLFGNKGIHTSEKKITDLQIQSSCYGVPIPIVFGTCKVASNIIDYDDFKAIKHKQTSGGKK